ncbi:hypothetical protein [Kribbella sp. NPDC004536]|uniref:hypothetical protein n=1 Tax=Kribbella sp. NPDC004536 TaxID=3364106 RepID=UPI0036AF1418
MRTYRWMWRTVAGGLLLLALGAGLLMLPAVIWMILAALAVPFGLMLAIGAETVAAESPRARRLHVVKLTMAGYLVAVGAVVLIKFLGAGALALLGVVLATSPSAVRLYGARLGRGRTERMPEATVSTSELCRVWLDSYRALNQAPTAKARLRVVMARQRCLDELERRDPDGLQAWLASSASAAGDPSRFLTDDR